MASPLRTYAAKIHEDQQRAVAAVFDGVDEDRRIMFTLENDEFVFVTHRERAEEGPPAWDVYLYRDWLKGPMVPSSMWPITAKLVFLDIAVIFRDHYLKEIVRYEAIAKARYE
jgi:hypothetical protein